MQLQNYYYWFKDAIPHHVCDDIVRYAKSIQDEMAVTGGLGNRKLNKKVTLTHLSPECKILLLKANPSLKRNIEDSIDDPRYYVVTDLIDREV